MEEKKNVRISRRDFMRYAAASAAALGLSNLDLGNAEKAMASATSPAVLWLSGSGCTGCSVSFLNAVNPTVDQILLNSISLKYHSTLMAAAGDLAVSAASEWAGSGGHILVVEGSIPTGAAERYCYVWDKNGQPVTMAAAVRELAAKAKHIVTVGTCAAYGGIPARYAPAGAMGVGAFLGRPVVNLPGCPVHPDWLVGALVQLLAGKVPSLDGDGRPTAYFKIGTIHDRCPRKGQSPARSFADQTGCLKNLGCKGPRADADCDKRKWNNGQSYCIAANAVCTACIEKDFPAFPLHKTP